MDQVVKQKWVEALRSGQYLQGKNALKTDDKFCCLGVLCDILYPEQWIRDGGYSLIWGEDSGLPPELRDSLSIDRKQEDILIQLNDEKGKDFLQIADYIEQNL